MKKVMANEAFVTGYIYSHKLERKVTGPNSKAPGTTFIQGTLNIATDDAMLNVVPIYYSYVVPTTKTGGTNNTYNVLSNVIDGKYKSVMEDGKENATIVRCDTAIELNDWFDAKNNDALVSNKRLNGGFIHVATELPDEEDKRATFKVDIVITNVKEQEEDVEKNIPAKAIIKGAVFNFRKALLPMEFSAIDPGAMSYFLSLGASNSNPVFTQIWGSIISQTVIKVTTEESAFGEALVKESRSSYKDYVVTGAKAEPYDWDTEESILASDLTAAIAEREVYLAAEKQRTLEYRASKNNAIPSATTEATVTSSGVVTAKGTYNF